jgi:hypothetical protein
MNRNLIGSRTFASIAGAAMALGSALIAGCYYEGGAGVSLDEHTFYSSSWQPKTVYLQDTRTKEVIWTVDIPVGKQLTVKIEKGAGAKDSMVPDRLLWQIFDQGTHSGVLNNSVTVPGGDDKQLSWKLRPAPELPEDSGGAHKETPKEPPIKVAPGEPTPPPAAPPPPPSPAP